MFTYLVTAFINVHRCWVHHSCMRRSLTTAEMVRLQPDSGRSARKRTKTITDREIGPVQSVTVLSDRGRGICAVTGRDSGGVSQTPDGHGRQLRPLGWSFMGWWQARFVSRDGCPRPGGDSMEWDPLVGLMLAGQQSRLHPDMIIRRQRGNWF